MDDIEFERQRREAERQTEAKLAQAHICGVDRENCDKIHPNTVARVHNSFKRTWPWRPGQNNMPRKHRNWCLDPKVMLFYIDPVYLEQKTINLTEIFGQMSMEGKLNILNDMIWNLLDENERSMLFSDLEETRDSAQN